jgi:hypothetical protein
VNYPPLLEAVPGFIGDSFSSLPTSFILNSLYFITFPHQSWSPSSLSPGLFVQPLLIPA